MNRTKWSRTLISRNNRQDRPGIVLLVTLVLLIILSALAYTVSSRLAVQRHRQQYIIDYQAARYACSSAAKYAFAELQDINTPPLISRPNEPDFSDLFKLNQAEYKKFLADWAEKNASGEKNSSAGTRDSKDINDANAHPDANHIKDANDTNVARDINASGDTNKGGNVIDFNDPNSLIVRGPYGPPWPFIIEPVEFKIGSATVKIEIEDENAKYPLGWMLLDSNDVQRETEAGLKTFCEWMDVNNAEIDLLKQGLKDIGAIKTFQIDFQPVTLTVDSNAPVTSTSARAARNRRRSSRQTTQTTVAPPTVHIADFAKLFHSSLIDTETLALPTIVTETRKESALKYMGLWASSKVNINTAPRQVLEAAFTFGGDADKIAEEIIQRRRTKPFTDIDDLKKALFRYSDSIGKCERYITMTSNFFTVRITAVSGVAEASTVFAVIKNDKNVEKIAEISG